MQTILEQAKALAPEIISWRHQIHMQPEVGLDLPKTVALVTEELKKMGYEPQECGGGVVAVLDSGKPGKTLLLRADMDALPMDEDSGEAFSSQVAKSAHTCGHDTHTSMLLSAVKIANSIKDQFSGTIRFISSSNPSALGWASRCRRSSGRRCGRPKE